MHDDAHGVTILRAVQPYLAAVAVTAMAAALIAAIYFTLLELQWIAFLAGILVAAILAMVTRASRAEWIMTRRTAQLQLMREKHAKEAKLRERADEALAAARARLRFVHEGLPAMVAYVDAEERYRYHNHAFRRWLGLKEADQIDGRYMREVLGDKAYAELGGAIKEALAGRTVQYERTQKMADGAVYHLSVQYLPHFGSDGKIAGCYALLTDITGREHVEIVQPGAADAAPPESSVQEMFDDTFAKQVTGWKNAADRIIAAIEKDEFRLYCQVITPLDTRAGLPDHYEILIRLLEEEENLMPPGAFFPLAEKFGLMPNLDRWVVRHALQWVSAHRQSVQQATMLCINLAGATINAPDFPDFVREQLRIFAIPGGAVCFEMHEPDVTSRSGNAPDFARQLREQGCHVALCGFGRDRVSFDLLKSLDVDFLKIDGSIILDILRDPVDLARATAINKVAQASGIRTIAEFVESDEVIAKLRGLGVNFAQGFGISRPRPLEELA